MSKGKSRGRSFSSISINQLMSGVLLLGLVLAFCVFAKGLIIPLVYAVVFSLMLSPIVGFIEKWTKWRVLAIVLPMLGVLLLLGLMIFFFSAQIANILSDFSKFKQTINGLTTQLVDWMESSAWAQNYLNIDQFNLKEWMAENGSDVLKGPAEALVGGIVSSSSVLVDTGMVVIYTFMILLYRRSFKNFVLFQFSKAKRPDARKVVQRIQQVIQRYIIGLGVVVVFLAILNSLGLWIIGVDYALFWGLLAACLAVIPYIGSFLGSLLPMLFLLLNGDPLWKPIVVFAWFTVLQQIEGNIITPKIVGKSVNLNALVVIVALLIGNAIWGISGMVLSLPLTAVVKIILDNINKTKSLGFVLSNSVYDHSSTFEEEFDEDKYRLFHDDSSEK